MGGKSKTSGYFGVTYYIGKCTSCGSWWHSEDTCCRFSKFYFPVEGEMEIEIYGEKIIGKPGELFFIPEGVKHSFRLTKQEKLKKYWFHFSLIPNILQTISEERNLPVRVQIADREAMVKEFEKVFTFAESDTLTAEMQLQSQIFKMVAGFLELAEKNGANLKRTTHKLPTLSYVAQYMADNMDRAVTLEELATLANLHPNYLIRSFKQQFGTTPVKYLNKMRLERAVSLICNSEQPFNEIMQQTGFVEPAYFSGFFKRETGYSPREFRRYYKEHQGPPPTKDKVMD